MPYETSDQSIHDAAPVEGYRFVGTFKTYRYTSNDEDVTIGGETFTSLVGIERKTAKAGTQKDDTSLVVEMPFDTEVVVDYAFDKSPPRLDLQIWRYHRQDNPAVDYIVMWSGRVANFTVAGRIAKLQVPSMFTTVLRGNLPNVFYQGPCNHVLFDSRCKLIRSSWNTSTTVNPGITEGARQIDVAADGFADGLLAGGEMVVTRTGERRMILDNQADLISITYPFTDIVDNEPVELTRGCNHLYGDATLGCKAFSNQVNFGGFPYIPGDNPFIGKIK